MKLPTNSGPGSLPTEKMVGVWSLKKPLPRPGSNITLFDWLLLTRRSRIPSPFTSWTTVDTGPEPTLSRGPGVKVMLLP
jgi:hypothetical protein